MPELERRNASQVVTYTQTMTSPRWLGTLGHVTGLTYSYTCPGGPDQMQCTLQREARFRTDALNPGRIVQIYRGASMIWEGKLDEPTPGDSGWTITAHGSGTYGTDFLAVYSGAWNTNPDSSINAAISRGMRWVNRGIGSPSGIWLGQAVDSGAQTITDLLNLNCSQGGLTWYVETRPSGNYIKVISLPTTVTNLLVAAGPVARTLGGDVNTIYLRYQTSNDAILTPSVFSTTSVTEQKSINLHGPMEAYLDLSSANVLSAGAAQTVGNLVLQRYQRASFAGPFPAGPGRLLTTGGAVVDLGMGMPQAPMVCRLILTDFGYGGEITPAPIQFLVGGYSYDDDAQTATITPFQYLRTSFSSLISAIGQAEPARKKVTRAQERAAWRLRNRTHKHFESWKKFKQQHPF